MFKYCIEGLSRIKRLNGVIHDGNFRYLETVKTNNITGSYCRYYNKGDFFDTLAQAEIEIARRRLEKIHELQNKIKVLNDESTIEVLDSIQSLHYNNSYLKDEKDFSYTVEVN